MSRITRELADLSYEARLRVVGYISDRYLTPAPWVDANDPRR